MNKIKCKNYYLVILLFFFLPACLSRSIDYSPLINRNFKQDMQALVIEISRYAREKSPGFIVISQNGHELLLPDNGTSLREEYLEAIDGIGQEDLFYGYDGFNQATPPQSHEYILNLVTTARAEGKQVLVTDYCNKPKLMDDSYTRNTAAGFVGFAAPKRDLTVVPVYPEVPYRLHDKPVATLAEIRNFLYLINPGKFEEPAAFVQALQATDYDLVLIDLFFDDEPLSSRQITALKQKQSGARRLVVSYMSIGEAEDYRFYWKKNWRKNPPVWLDRENPDWDGNYKVRYWEEQWQRLIISSPDSYLNRILSAGFDGVYLDIIDAFNYFEQAVVDL